MNTNRAADSRSKKPKVKQALDPSSTEVIATQLLSPYVSEDEEAEYQECVNLQNHLFLPRMLIPG